MYDLLLTGGAGGRPVGRLERAARHRRSGRQELPTSHPLIAGDEAALLVIDVSGRTVTPGLIDLHAHVFDGVISNGVHPDLGGVHSGRHHGGRSPAAPGAPPFSAFPPLHHAAVPYRDHSLPPHLPDPALATMPGHRGGKQHRRRLAALRTVDENRGLIHGIKARMVSPRRWKSSAWRCRRLGAPRGAPKAAPG